MGQQIEHIGVGERVILRRLVPVAGHQIHVLHEWQERLSVTARFRILFPDVPLVLNKIQQPFVHGVGGIKRGDPVGQVHPFLCGIHRG